MDWNEATKLRPLCWGLAYRMTGTVQDADDVAQDAFVRLAERPPADTSRPLRPWLVAVTLNLARDRLRQRRRQAYVGPWLPAPVPDTRLAEDALADRQSASWAFLRAAEALSPTQRAVFLAREVLELDAAETAAALAMTRGAVDVALHRARKALGAMPAAPSRADDAAVLAFLACVRLGLVDAATRLLAPGAALVNDGGGHVNSARRPVEGAAKIVRFLRRTARLHTAGVRWRVTRCNGLLTFVGESRQARGRLPPRFTFACEVQGGRITRLWSQLAPDKLGAVG